MLTRRKCKSLTEVHGYQLTGQVSDLYHVGHYKNAFKACTSLFRPPEADDQRLHGVTLKKGMIRVKKPFKRINDQMQSSMHDKKLKPTTIYKALQWGSSGVSPLKMGRP
jgi:hypothetical protein